METFTNSKVVIDDFNNKLAELEKLIDALYSFGWSINTIERIVDLIHKNVRTKHELEQEIRPTLFSWEGISHG